MSSELIATRRWERRRRLLPNLRLRYPTDTEAQRLSELACVKDGPAFSSHLRSIILDAHLNDAILRGLSIPKVRTKLKTVTTCCDGLRRALVTIDVESAGQAAVLFKKELGSQGFNGKQVLIPDCLEFLDRMKDAGSKAKERLDDAIVQGPSSEALNNVTVRCRELRRTLAAMDVGTGGSAERAGFLFEMELGCDDFKGQQMLIPACLQFLDRMKDAASKATPSTKSKRGPRGTTGTPAFGAFIESLQMAARQRGGDWTIYRAADQSWTGSLLEAVMTLKPYLPNNFLPRSEVGRPVEYNKRKLMEHIRNNLPSAK